MVKPWYKNKDVKATYLEVGDVHLKLKIYQNCMDSVKSYNHCNRPKICEVCMTETSLHI